MTLNPLSHRPHSVCRHVLLPHGGIPAPGPLSAPCLDLQPFTLELVALPVLVSSQEDSSVKAEMPSFMLVKEVEELGLS